MTNRPLTRFDRASYHSPDLLLSLSPAPLSRWIASLAIERITGNHLADTVLKQSRQRYYSSIAYSNTHTT